MPKAVPVLRMRRHVKYHVCGSIILEHAQRIPDSLRLMTGSPRSTLPLHLHAVARSHIPGNRVCFALLCALF